MKLFRRIRSNNTDRQKDAHCLTAAACLSGKVVPMAEIPDPVFAEGILGPCIGIRPP